MSWEILRIDDNNKPKRVPDNVPVPTGTNSFVRSEPYQTWIKIRDILAWKLTRPYLGPDL